MVLSLSTILIGGVGRQLSDVFVDVFDLGSISELTSTLLPTAVAGVFNTDKLGEMMGQALEQCREPLVGWVAEKVVGDPNALVQAWIAAEHEWRQFTGSI